MPQVIRITRSLSYFNNQPAPVPSGAEVYVIEESTGTRFDLSLIQDSIGLFSTERMRGKVGSEYSLIINDGDASYKATSLLDTVAQMDSINYEYEFFDYFKFGFYKIRMSAYEPPPLGDIYMFNIYKNDTLVNDRLFETPYQDDILFNDSYLANVEIIYIPQEEIFLDTNTIRVEMLSISEDEFNYNNNFLNETYGNGSIFSGPPANIPSNIKNTSGGIDGLGFFGASSVISLSMTLIKEHDESTNNPDYD
jgi:hypothetical protein